MPGFDEELAELRRSDKRATTISAAHLAQTYPQREAETAATVNTSGFQDDRIDDAPPKTFFRFGVSKFGGPDILG